MLAPDLPALGDLPVTPAEDIMAASIPQGKASGPSTRRARLARLDHRGSGGVASPYAGAASAPCGLANGLKVSAIRKAPMPMPQEPT